MRVLALDIETTPNLAYVWGLWDQSVGLSQLVDPTEMLCFVAKWVGEPGPALFYGGRYDPAAGADPDGHHRRMVEAAHKLLCEADVVLHYNGQRFDVPHLRREMLLAGLTPPSPFRQVDLLQTCRKQFKFPSNKLAYVTKALGFKGKIGTDFDLWKACLRGEPAAWAKMARYNKRDVLELIRLYHRLLPWIPGAPNAGLDPSLDGLSACPSCGGTKLERRGYAYTSVSRYQVWHCLAPGCGRYSRSGRRDAGVDLRAVAE